MAARAHKQRSKLHAAQAAAAAAAAAHAVNSRLPDNAPRPHPLDAPSRPQSLADKVAPAAPTPATATPVTVPPVQTMIQAAESRVHPLSHSESVPSPVTSPESAPPATSFSQAPLALSATTPSERQQSTHSERAEQVLMATKKPAAPAVRTVDRPGKLETAIDVIRRQFDLEILLKHRELSCIEDEIAKVHIMMVQLRRCAGKTVNDQDEPDDFAKHYAQYLLPDRRYSEGSRPDQYKSPDGVSPTSTAPDSIDSTGMQPRSRSIPTSNRMHLPQYSANGTVGGNPPPDGCIYRRPDGILVRLVCKDCSRTTFGSAQGFINHCRISHGREFTSHDNAAQCCGEELNESDQDDIGLGALKHRRHMQMSSAGPMLSLSPDAQPPPQGLALQRVTHHSALPDKPSGQTDAPTIVNPTELEVGVNASSKRDYGTKSFPWNYHSSSTSFLNQPITPPSDDQIPRQVSDILSSTADVPATSTTTEPVTVATTASTMSSTPTPTAIPFMPTLSAPTPPPTRHLSNLLKRKQVDVDLDHMAAESVKRDPLGHLFPGEADVSDDEEEARLPSVAKYKKLAGAQRGRPLGSGMRIVASFH
ncbi:uncharacterized protein V1513DRAFT_447734 [Lipomyces chichibuensis]|uniref:uncharacterized protein n=1 Tax=Lipomyces chichibuensis TaxID=1546026 RepID=UPI0033436B2A